MLSNMTCAHINAKKKAESCSSFSVRAFALLSNKESNVVGVFLVSLASVA